MSAGFGILPETGELCIVGLFDAYRGDKAAAGKRICGIVLEHHVTAYTGQICGFYTAHKRFHIFAGRIMVAVIACFLGKPE